MVREKLGPEPRPPQTLLFSQGREKLRHGLSSWGDSDHGLSLGCFWDRGRRVGSRICFSLQKFLAISSPTQKIASDYSCDVVGHSAPKLLAALKIHPYLSAPVLPHGPK